MSFVSVADNRSFAFFTELFNAKANSFGFSHISERDLVFKLSLGAVSEGKVFSILIEEIVKYNAFA